MRIPVMEGGHSPSSRQGQKRNLEFKIDRKKGQIREDEYWIYQIQKKLEREYAELNQLEEDLRSLGGKPYKPTPIRSAQEYFGP